MSTAKEEVLRILDRLLDDASLEDIQYQLYVLQKINHGLADIEAGHTISEEEFDRRMVKWSVYTRTEGTPPMSRRDDHETNGD